MCASLLSDNGIMLLHDVGATLSAEIDASGKGGVRRALLELHDDQSRPSLKVETTFSLGILWKTSYFLKYENPPVGTARTAFAKLSERWVARSIELLCFCNKLELAYPR